MMFLSIMIHVKINPVRYSWGYTIVHHHSSGITRCRVLDGELHDCCRHPTWLYCMQIDRGFAVDLVCKSPGISQDLLSISSFFAGEVPRFEHLRLTPAAIPLPMNAKSRDRPMRMQQVFGITRGSCGSRLIEGGSGRYIRPRSGPSIQ